ncbi:hypothetical protein BDZ97DRAFT_70178 [Flammula alnicola]|nr:hypothetical protein BDZ97DRAFT_70178 [Flammula alnicola]
MTAAITSPALASQTWFSLVQTVSPQYSGPVYTMSNYDDALPSTIKVGDGASMTFPRNEAYLARVHISAMDHNVFYVPPHWHPAHDELFHVIQGRLEVLIGTEKRVCTPSDGEIRIPKGVIHSLQAFIGEECIFEERTEPMDDEKELFFRNSFADGRPPTNVFKTMQIMYYGDMRPVLPGHILWLENLIVTVIGRYLAPLVGYKLKYESLKKL